MKNLIHISLIKIFTLFSATCFSQVCQPENNFDFSWSSQFGQPGANGTVACFAKGNNGEIYVGGGFASLGGDSRINGIGLWNGECWQPLGDGLNGTVLDIAVGEDGIYVAGDFTDAGGIEEADYVAKWDGSKWSAIGRGINARVWTIHLFNDLVFIGDGFTNLNSQNTDYLAYWDGANWSSLGTGVDGNVYSIEDMGGNLFIGGAFKQAGGVEFTSHIAKWNGDTWEALDFGLNSTVFTMTASESKLYIGGRFTNAGPDLLNANRLVIWNGNDWENVGSSSLFDNRNVDPNDLFTPPILTVIWSIAVEGDDVYISGDFSAYNFSFAKGNMIKFNGENWSNVDADSETSYPFLGEIVNSILVDNGELFVGGNFTNHAKDFRLDRLTKWDGSNWVSLIDNNGLLNPVRAIVNDDEGNIYAGGSFVESGGINWLVKWNGNNWESLGLNLNSGATIYDMTWFNGELYVAGSFRNANGNENSDYIVKWNGVSWEPLGTGLSGVVRALKVFDGALYVGGSFRQAGGLNGTGLIAKWNGSSWESIGSNMTVGNVFAIEAIGSDLFIGGSFGNFNDIPNADYIVKWNGTSWEGLDTGFGLNDDVFALATDGVNLFVGGRFTTADKLTDVNRIAKWTGVEWERVSPSGMNGNVLKLLFVNNTLYAGGTFTTADEKVVNFLASWDGSIWNNLGSGLNSTVLALHQFENKLYTGGLFTTTGRGVRFTSGFGIYDLAPLAVADEIEPFNFTYGEQPQQPYRVSINNLKDDFLVSTSEGFEFSFDSGNSFVNEVIFTSSTSSEAFIDLIVRPKAGLNAGVGQGFIETELTTDKVLRTTISTNISKAPLMITAEDKEFTYGEELPTFTLRYDGFVGNDKDSDIDIKPTLSTIATADSDAGVYDIDLSGGSDNNYNIENQTGRLTLTKSVLVVTADDKVIISGEDLP
ncbi:MAG: MBG domain-containing protein, partial [Bacteroidota bacterium]